ncbi:MAG: 2-oxoacid:ferredoxin oxidoreductase subunit beta [Desulfobacterales bacterium]|nr:2-oxoacid:ferredoxin oxidoreductase subunit beta [Desulfobacterales bacterium]
MAEIKEYDSDVEIKWCPGCGNFGILDAMKDALFNLDIPPEKILVISGIGQAAKTPHYLKCNLFHALHGRALPLATGAKIANHGLTILVNSGDGDCYGEGGNHFIHAVRRNIDITLLVHNNKVYGLTKGQASPTSDEGMVTKMQSEGVISETFNPLSVALALGAGFVARGFSGKTGHLSRIIREGIKHKGLSFIDILQPCVSFNHVNTFDWYRKRVWDLFEEGYIPNDFNKAMELAGMWGDKIPIGIIYQKEKPSYTDKIKILKESTLVSGEYLPENVQKVIESL